VPRSLIEVHHPGAASASKPRNKAVARLVVSTIMAGAVMLLSTIDGTWGTAAGQTAPLPPSPTPSRIGAPPTTPLTLPSPSPLPGPGPGPAATAPPGTSVPPTSEQIVIGGGSIVTPVVSSGAQPQAAPGFRPPPDAADFLPSSVATDPRRAPSVQSRSGSGITNSPTSGPSVASPPASREDLGGSTAAPPASLLGPAAPIASGGTAADARANPSGTEASRPIAASPEADASLASSSPLANAQPPASGLERADGTRDAVQVGRTSVVVPLIAGLAIVGLIALGGRRLAYSTTDRLSSYRRPRYA